jgi:predicted acetyltransferase
MTVLLLVSWIVGLLSVIVVVWGFVHFEEWEIGIEFLPKNYNNFELGISNRNYELTDGGLEQELRIGLLLFTFLIIFRRFDA